MNPNQIEQDYQEALRRIHYAEETHAVSLDLSGLIWDRIPPDLFRLAWLEELALQQSGDHWENWDGNIPILPIGFIKLQALRRLNICKLGAQDLSPLTVLTQLSSLNCSFNALTDLSPLTALTQLSSLDCSSNRLTDLSPLTALTQLSSLDCRYNQLTNLSPLTALTQLSSLDCRYNQLTNLSPLTVLTQLSSLDCSGNQLTNLSPLTALTQLSSLDCRYNQLTDLSPLTALTQLSSLNCGGNQLTDLFDFKPLVLKGQLQNFVVFGNPAKGIPREILGRHEYDNVAQSLLEYWRDLDQGSETNRNIKILFVGNGCVGKTTLAYGLRYGSPPPSPIEERTHAIEIEKLEVPLSSDGPGLQWHLWDFGGQELYHATHRLFLHHQALFLLLWAEETDESVDEIRYPVNYWLNFIQDLTSDSPVFLVKNQIDRQDQHPRPLDLPEGSSPFVQELKVSALQYQGVETLKGAVVDYLKYHPEHWAYELPASWLRLRDDLEGRRTARLLPRAHFAQLCLQYGVKHQHTVLKYFHESGFLFYREGAFQDQVILDQNWMIDLVYRLFDHRTGARTEILRQHGQFSGKDTQRFWPDHSAEDRQVILNFLTGSRMAFALDQDQRGNISFEEHEFVLPALLPQEPPLGVLIWGEGQSDEWWVDFSYAFLHRGLIESIIVRTAQLSPQREWWRDGVVFFDEQTRCQVLAQFAPEDSLSSTIRFRLRGSGRPETLVQVRRLLEELHPHRKPEMFVSLNGKDYASLDILTNARQEGKAQVSSRQQNIIEVQPYQMFLRLPEPEEGKSSFPKIEVTAPTINLFISYSHKDTTPFKKDLDVCLKNLKIQFPSLQFWGDGDLLAGELWETTLLDQLEQAHIVCLLISRDFFASEYCFGVEMKHALAKYEEGKGIPIPILIRATSDWDQLPIGKHQALPTPAKPLEDWPSADKFWANVQQGLRLQIEHLLETFLPKPH